MFTYLFHSTSGAFFCSTLYYQNKNQVSYQSLPNLTYRPRRSSSSPRTPSTDGGDPTPPTVPRTPRTFDLIEDAYQTAMGIRRLSHQPAQGQGFSFAHGRGWTPCTSPRRGDCSPSSSRSPGPPPLSLLAQHPPPPVPLFPRLPQGIHVEPWGYKPPPPPPRSVEQEILPPQPLPPPQTSSAFDFQVLRGIRFNAQRECVAAAAGDTSPPPAPPPTLPRPFGYPGPPPPPPSSHHIIHHRPQLPTASTGAIPRVAPRSPPSHSAIPGALRDPVAAMAAAEAAVAEAAARSRAAVVERMVLVNDNSVTSSTSRSNNERVAAAARVEPEDSIAHVAPARRGGGSGKDLKELLPPVNSNDLTIWALVHAMSGTLDG